MLGHPATAAKLHVRHAPYHRSLRLIVHSARLRVPRFHPWKPGLGEAARPTAERLRWALLGWRSVEPVQASETFERDVRIATPPQLSELGG